ncbi:MAG: acetyl-CoA carboxylase biotin carboxyl carrier protein [Candidatus Rokuibacteriota bacterium]|nr:MAG: acetyl-CoA carboxylase biotin carboxyl carrier protein [Candidatus Rokubacteria bacterium]
MARRRRPSGGREAATGEVPAVELVRRLATLLTELGLTELEVTAGDVRVRLQRGGVAPAPAIVPVERPAVAHTTEIESAAGVTIEAPMVGTFYRASSPTADPYVSEGDLVKEGQILCIIEAMKLMNEIESKVAGRVVKIFVENAHPVEFGQPLFLIDPAR